MSCLYICLKDQTSSLMEDSLPVPGTTGNDYEWQNIKYKIAIFLLFCDWT